MELVSQEPVGPCRTCKFIRLLQLEVHQGKLRAFQDHEQLALHLGVEIYGDSTEKECWASQSATFNVFTTFSSTSRYSLASGVATWITTLVLGFFPACPTAREEEEVAQLRSVFPSDAFAPEALLSPIGPEAWDAKRQQLLVHFTAVWIRLGFPRGYRNSEQS